MRPIVIIQHEDGDPPATVGRYLTDAGFHFEVCDLMHQGKVPASPDEFSALIVLGGDMNVHDDDEYQFLAIERELMRTCLRAEAPLLAICLGAQQLAAAAGGSVYHRAMPEIGWAAVEIDTPDPLMVGVESPFWCLEWHDYSFTLPPGALRIASRPDGEQVFRLGARAWGVQFHPETDDLLLRRWLADGEPRLEELRPGWTAEIRADAQVHMPAYPRFCGRLVGNFLEAAGLVIHARPA
jgi:GMP synthase-like glutamine amidotransferase